MFGALRVYVAGAWVEKEERAIPVIKALREAGIVITHDWTADENNVSNAVTSDSQLPREYRLKHAQLDRDGVLTAHLVLLLAPRERGASGAWTEFGMALARKEIEQADPMRQMLKSRTLLVFVSGTNCRRTIFTELADECIESDADAVARIILIAAS